MSLYEWQRARLNLYKRYWVRLKRDLDYIPKGTIVRICLFGASLNESKVCIEINGLKSVINYNDDTVLEEFFEPIEK